MKDFNWKDWLMVLMPTIIIVAIWFIVGLCHPQALTDIRKINDKPLSNMSVGDLMLIILLIYVIFGMKKTKQ